MGQLLSRTISKPEAGIDVLSRHDDKRSLAHFLELLHHLHNLTIFYGTLSKVGHICAIFFGEQDSMC